MLTKVFLLQLCFQALSHLADFILIQQVSQNNQALEDSDSKTHSQVADQVIWETARHKVFFKLILIYKNKWK